MNTIEIDNNYPGTHMYVELRALAANNRAIDTVRLTGGIRDLCLAVSCDDMGRTVIQVMQDTGTGHSDLTGFADRRDVRGFADMLTLMGNAIAAIMFSRSTRGEVTLVDLHNGKVTRSVKFQGHGGRDDKEMAHAFYEDIRCGDAEWGLFMDENLYIISGSNKYTITETVLNLESPEMSGTGSETEIQFEDGLLKNPKSFRIVWQYTE